MNKIKWCLNVKRGVKLIKPNENLSKSYIKKAEDSLISMRVNLREGIKDWASSAAYYARISYPLRTVNEVWDKVRNP